MGFTVKLVNKIAGVFAAAMLLVGTTPLFAQGAPQSEKPTSKPAAQEKAKDAKKERKLGGGYPLDTCVVSGEPLGSMGDPVVVKHEGREVKLCCEGCVDSFKKDPEKYLKKIDAAILDQQLPDYPLEVCLASGEKLGVMGDPYTFVYENRAIKLCCEGCASHFDGGEEGDKMVKKLDKAVMEKQRKDYPLETCVVSGEKLGSMSEPVEFVHAGKLVRICCEACVDQFEKNPAKYMKAIKDAKKEAAAKDDTKGAQKKAKPAAEREKDDDHSGHSHGPHDGHNH
jgi:YHS domain-containing protein